MHSWEMMSESYDQQHSWPNPMQTIKSEPMEMTGNYGMATADSPPAHHHSMHTNAAMLQSAANNYFLEHIQTMNNPQTPPTMYRQNLHQMHQGMQQDHQQPQHQQLNYPGQQQYQSTPYRTFGAAGSVSDTTSPITSSISPVNSPIMDDTPPKSVKDTEETPDKDSEMQSNSGDEQHHDSDDEEDIRTPKVNSHGKVKTFKCKQCDFVAVTKMTFWEHTREHIRPEKMLNCPKCPFVTEYKHHLEYHMRNHDGTKPFQCDKCSYSCVNKSMLNSHAKSHSNVYQYRCMDCVYATKYCHSLKLHLRKYNHKADMVLNQDGTPNPLPIIDVYGTRRGPKSRSTKKKAGEEACKEEPTVAETPAQMAQHIFEMQQQQQQQQMQQQQQLQMQHQQHFQQQLMAFQQQQQQPQLAVPNVNLPPIMTKGLADLFPYLKFHPMFAAQHQQALAQLNGDDKSSIHMQNPDDDEDTESNHEPESEPSVLDLTASASPFTPNRLESIQQIAQNIIFPTPHITPSTIKNRRKGRAFKLDISQDSVHTPVPDLSQGARMEQCEATPPATPMTPNAPIKPAVSHLTSDAHSTQTTPESNYSQDNKQVSVSSSTSDQAHHYECKPCGIAFKDAVLHTIHMGYHGFNDAFTCNMCGVKCEDRVSFFMHIARNSHS